MSSYRSRLKEKLPKEGGFTIIEVVLVLAIAGLIFLIVFLALPQLQRSRRDTQRRADAGRVLAAAENYAQNNNGQYPTTTANVADLQNNYLRANGSVFSDPSNGDYALTYTANPDQSPLTGTQTTSNVMLFVQGSNCDGAGNSRDIAVKVAVEEGGVYCQDNR